MSVFLKQFIVVVFLASFIAQTIGNGFYIADYYMHYEKYAKNCINKTRPKLHCNGKCQLMKKIQEYEKSEKEKSEKEFSGRIHINLTDKNYFFTVNDINTADQPIQPLYRNTIELSSFTSPVFHPPCWPFAV